MNIIILFLLFATKHFIVDWVIQTNKMATEKGNNFYYLFLHSFEHAILSFLILINFTNVETALLLSASEIFTHGGIDYLKANKKLLGRYKYPSKLYFVILGADQFVHQINYLLFIYLIT